MQKISYRKIGAAFLVALALLLVTVIFNRSDKPAPSASLPSAEAPSGEASSVPAVKEASRVQVFAGSLMPGSKDGTLEQAQFVKPYGLCVDGDGLLVVDSYNNLLRKVAGGRVATVAGTAAVTDRTGYPLGGYLNGAAGEAMLDRPRFAAVSTLGAVVFSDSGNQRLRVLDGDRVYLLAGSGETGYLDGFYAKARFNTPSGVAIGSDGTVFAADTLNHCIRVITGDGQVSTLTGDPQKPGFRDGTLAEAQFCEPNDLALGPDGALYVVDKGNQRVRKILNGMVSTVAGSGSETDKTTGYIIGGYQDGAADSAQFLYPTGLCVSESGVIYLADTGNNCIRAISPEGEVITAAGSKTAGNAGGAPGDARFNQPLDVVLWNDTLYITDSYNHGIRSIAIEEETLFAPS